MLVTYKKKKKERRINLKNLRRNQEREDRIKIQKKEIKFSINKLNSIHLLIASFLLKTQEDYYDEYIGCNRV